MASSADSERSRRRSAMQIGVANDRLVVRRGPCGTLPRVKTLGRGGWASGWRGVVGAGLVASLAACSGDSVVGGSDAGDDVPANPADTGTDVPVDAGSPLDVPAMDAPAADVLADAGPADTGVVDDAGSPADVPAADAGPRCPARQTLCGEVCADLEADALHCGACGTACGFSERCVAGRCALRCPEGQSVCGGRCVDPATDPAHCGACDSACAEGQRCTRGVCAATCGAGLTACGARCVDTQTSVAHCGACDAACAAGEACVAGRCALLCTQGLTVCGTQCRDLQNDPAHCGMCGLACPARANAASVCVAGACRSFCNTGFADCDGDPGNGCEVDTRGSVDHCGACGNRCASTTGTAACAMGRCTVTACMTGRGNCDGDGSNGCEVDLTGSATHCGACGTACPGGGRCLDGRCAVVGASCNAIHTARPELGSGEYLLDPDGDGPGAPFAAYCDMTTDGGGWTFVATVTNNGDGPNVGNWLVSSPTPNAWESPSATFGTLDPALNQDYRSPAFHRVRGRAILVTHRNLFLLRTDAQCLADITLRDRFAMLGWDCGGSASFTAAPPCTHACVIAASTVRTGDGAMLNGAQRTRLFLKAGEADGAQDTNRDRSYLSTEARDNVDYPMGLGAFCSGASCSPRTGDADVNNRSDAITPAPGTEFYGIWVR